MGIDSTPPRAGGLPARLLLGPALRAQSDRRLTRLVREGYESAFEEIVRRYRRPLDRFAASIVGGRSEDVTQDSFRKALVALRRGDGEIELRPWLFRIVHNTALNELRDRPATTDLADDGAGTVRSAAAEAEERADVAALTERLRTLPEKQRTALVMRELEGMGHGEIAAALGISRGAARQAIARGRAAVRDGLGLLVPLPLLRLAAEGGAGAASAAAGGAAAGGGGALALKVGLATVLVAGSVGAGVAIDHHAPGRHRSAPPRTVAAATPRPGHESRARPSYRSRSHRSPTLPAPADPGAGRRGGPARPADPREASYAHHIHPRPRRSTPGPGARTPRSDARAPRPDVGEGRLGGEPTPSASSPRPYDGSRQLSYGAHRGPPHHGSSAPSSTAEDDPHPASTPERTTTSHTWTPPAEDDPHPAYGPPAAAAPESDTAASPGYTHPYASATGSRGGDSAWSGHGGPHEGEAAPSGDPERPARPAEFATRSEFAP